MQFISEDRGVGLDVLPHMLLQFGLAASLDVQRADSPATLNHAEHDLFAVLPTTRLNLPGLVLGVHIAGLAANEGFIDLDIPGQLVKRAGLHCKPDSVEHEPCGLLADLQVLGDLVAADAVLAIRDQPHGAQPFVQADSGVLEDGPDLDRELLFAVQAFPDQARFEEREPLGRTLRANRPVRPAQLSHELDTHLGIGKVLHRFH